MNNFDDLAALWKAPAPEPLPDVADIIKKASREKNQVARKIFIQSSCMLLAIASLVYVVCAVHFHYFITYLGLAMMFICMISFAVVRFRQSRFLKRADFSQSPASLLNSFEDFHRRQQWVNTTGTFWYSVFLNIAFALYFYETVALAPIRVGWKWLFLAVYVVWMLIAMLWIGKRSVRKEHAKTRAIIEKLRAIKETIAETETH
ncbi:MAG: hypothetical protein JWQ27_2601 [Ferruginibacter sp.]|nr:hypothetical protein [Ferruginibacter sp.]